MNPEDHGESSVSYPWLRVIASIAILIQFLLFILNYNFTSNIFILAIGWVVLPIGLGLIMISSKQQQTLSDIEVESSSRLSKFIPYPLHLGWVLVSIALALISQQWYTLLLAIGFVTAVILDGRKRT